MKRTPHALSITCSLLILLTACGRHSDADGKSKHDLKIMVHTLDGSEYDLRQLKGNVLVVDFWATWCKPCIGEIPEYNRLHETFKDKNVQMLGITMNSGDGNKIRQYVTEYEIDYSIFNGGNQAPAYFGSIEALPTTFILDQHLNIRKKYVGSPPGKTADIAAIIEELLAESSSSH